MAAGLLGTAGVRVTSVSPGMVDTELSKNSPFEEGRKKLTPEDIANSVRSMYFVPRF